MYRLGLGDPIYRAASGVARCTRVCILHNAAGNCDVNVESPFAAKAADSPSRDSSPPLSVSRTAALFPD